MSCRLFIEPDRLRQGNLEVSGEDHNYLFRARRLRPDAEVVLFDGQGRQAVARIATIRTGTASLEVEKPQRVETPVLPRMVVLQGLIKGERMEWCIQKLVELGVDEIVPLQTARSVVKLSASRAESRGRRHLLVARDAARQCGSALVPRIAPAMELAQGLVHAADAALKLFFWERRKQANLASALPEAVPDQVAILVGPEGGFDDDEAQLAQDSGFVPVGLGRRTLRAETASIAAVAALSFAFPTDDPAI